MGKNKGLPARKNVAAKRPRATPPKVVSQEELDRRMDEIWSGKPTLKKLIEMGEISADFLPSHAFHQLRALRWALRRERERQGLSQNALAKAAGIDGPMLSRIEAGKVFQPTIGTLSRIAEALGLEFTIAVGPRTAKKTEKPA